MEKTYEQLSDDFSLLVKDQDWNVVRSWFAYYQSSGELADKVLIWGRFFLPTFLRDESPAFHKKLIEENFSAINEYTAAPRGFAKTTINQLCLAYMCAHKFKRFIVVVEKSYTEAAEVLKTISTQFKDNQAITMVYGKTIKLDDKGQLDEKNKDSYGDVMINGTRLRAKGFNAPIRGLKSNEWRPDLILLDDVESDEHIGNDEQRKKYRENYTQGIVPAVDISGSIKVRGTILHNDSLLKNLIDQFHGTVYKAFDKNDPEHTLLWPQRWTYPLLMQKKAEMEMEGKGSSKFYQEFLNEAVDDENRAFKWEWLQKTFTDEDLKSKALSRTITIDVAESKKDGADFTGVTIIDWDQDNNWYIQYAKRYKINITSLVDTIFQLWLQYKPNKIGVEKKAFEDQLKPLLRMRSEETGIFPVVVELQHGGKQKEDRIRGALQGRLEVGKIWFKKDIRDDQNILRGELYDFPHAKNDDLGDSLAYHQNIGFRPFGKSLEQQSIMETEFWAHKKQMSGSSMVTHMKNL